MSDITSMLAEEERDAELPVWCVYKDGLHGACLESATARQGTSFYLARVRRRGLTKREAWLLASRLNNGGYIRPVDLLPAEGESVTFWVKNENGLPSKILLSGRFNSGAFDVGAYALILIVEVLPLSQVISWRPWPKFDDGSAT